MNENGTELAVIEKNPLAITDTSPDQMRQRAMAVAKAAEKIVLACTQNIQGRRYVKVDGWQAVANTYGCVASAGHVEKVDGGWVAHATVKHLGTGQVVAEGEGFVGEDEKMWMGRPLFARRSMAQTRAIGRACRAAFAFIIPMIDAGLSTTPAEEMTHVEDEEPAPRRTASKPSFRVEDVPPEDDVPAHDAVTGEVIEPGSVGEKNEADIASTILRVQKAENQGEALKIVNASPPHVKKRVVQAYREAWVK